MGEVDLIMIDDNTLVFVEVRYRSNTAYGDPLETVTRSKQRKIIRTASHYLLAKFNSHDIACRFDVVAVTRQQDKQLTFNWIKSAFY